MSRYNDKYSNFQIIKKYIKSKFDKSNEDKEIFKLKYNDIVDISFIKNSSNITAMITTNYKKYLITIDEDEFMGL